MSSHQHYRDGDSLVYMTESQEAHGEYQEETEEPAAPRQTLPLPLPIISITSSSPSGSRTRHYQGSDTETESLKKPTKMSSRSSKHHSSSSSKKHHSSSKKTKTDDWTQVTEREERRRIQNRIAQRKFREKAREQKDRAERDARNQEHAGSSYHIPEPDDISVDEELSGLPWGGPNLRYVVARGHETASQQGSRRASDHRLEETQCLNYVGEYQRPISWDGRDSSGMEERYYDESSYYYDYYTSAGSSTR